MSWHLDAVANASSRVHRERHVARRGEQVDDVGSEDVVEREASRTEPLGVRAENAPVRRHETAANCGLIEEEIVDILSGLKARRFRLGGLRRRYGWVPGPSASLRCSYLRRRYFPPARG
ncbi:MAG TPA: hypothetical protein VMK12_00580 [Anaeromyxobacteraceae bacterium]|nr:hypothetical protein [Anaeromyxobacteraceae bacterium]